MHKGLKPFNIIHKYLNISGKVHGPGAVIRSVKVYRIVCELKI